MQNTGFILPEIETCGADALCWAAEERGKMCS